MVLFLLSRSKITSNLRQLFTVITEIMFGLLNHHSLLKLKRRNKPNESKSSIDLYTNHA